MILCFKKQISIHTYIDLKNEVFNPQCTLLLLSKLAYPYWVPIKCDEITQAKQTALNMPCQHLYP